MKTDTTPKVIELKDYKAPNFFIETIHLTVKLHSTETIVISNVKVKRNGNHQEALVLNGEELKLLSVKLDGTKLNDSEFK